MQRDTISAKKTSQGPGGQMVTFRSIAKSAALRFPPTRRIADEREELRRTVDALVKAVAERDAAIGADEEKISSLTERIEELELDRRRLSEFRDRGEDGAITPLALSQPHVEGATLFANRRTALALLPKGGRVAEVGVAYGDFSSALIADLRPEVFHAYDLFPWTGSEIIWGRPARETLKGMTHKAFYEHRFADLIGAGTLELRQGDSSTELSRAPGDYYDVIYIDARHDYEAVKRDADVAKEKLKRDGFLVFNDYIMYDHIQHEPYGIVPVVNQLCVDEGWIVVYFALDPQMFCDICIRRGDRRR